MAENVTGFVRRLYKFEEGDGYEVQVILDADGLEIEIAIQTAHAEPAQATEAARRWLQRLGTTMAKSFDHAGSLK